MKIGNLEVYGIIYKIINIVNGKVYIGQTISDKGFNRRYSFSGNGIERVYRYYNWCESIGRYNNKHLLSSIKKYGLEAFKVDELFDVAFSEEELNIKEESWIKFFECRDKNKGYNSQVGGNNHSPNKDSVDKMKNTLKGKFLGDKNPFFGKKHTQETKNKMRNFHYNCEGHNNSNSKAIICTTTNIVFLTMKDAGKYYHLKGISGISQVCNNSRRYSGKLENGTKLQWKHISNLTSEEYIKYDIENKLKELKNKIGDDY